MLSTDGAVQIQAGDGADSTLNIQTTDINAQMNGIDFFSMDLSTQAGAASAMSTLDQSLEVISEARAEYGAVQNRLESRVDTVQEQRINMESARSRLIDTDYAQATADRSRQQIIGQANLAMQGHANASRGDVLQLLQF
jgi:flagellin